MEETAAICAESSIKIPFNTYYSSNYAILFSIVCWTLFYYGVKLIFPNKDVEWVSRVITLFHGFGAAVNGLPECFADGEEFFHGSCYYLTDNQQVIFVVTLGYFIFDSVWCICYQTESKLMIAHHLFSVGALYRILSRNVGGSETVCALGGMEITNPILQARWFLRSEGFKDTKLFTSVEIVFMLLFFTMRLGFGTYYFYNVVFLYDYDWEYKFMTITLYTISILFVVSIIQYVSHKYFSDMKQNIMVTTTQ